ncbi:MAG: hypothetical protein OXG98_04780 [Gemmatimonadetes bacterium]|nr:hypothetical protein [Gemmatimonadota bacterium]
MGEPPSIGRLQRESGSLTLEGMPELKAEFPSAAIFGDSSVIMEAASGGAGIPLSTLPAQYREYRIRGPMQAKQAAGGQVQARYGACRSGCFRQKQPSRYLFLFRNDQAGSRHGEAWLTCRLVRRGK